MKRVFILMAIAVAVFGCQSIKENQSRQDDAACADYGVYRGSAGYVQCRMYMEQKRQRAIAQIGHGLSQIGDALGPQPTTQTKCQPTYGGGFNCSTW